MVLYCMEYDPDPVIWKSVGAYLSAQGNVGLGGF